MPALLGRRGAVSLVASSLTARWAWAQTSPAPEIAPTPPAPTPATPAPATPTPAPASPAPPVPAPAATPPARAAATAGGIDRTKAYYVFFDGMLDDARTHRLRQQLASLAEAGVREITLVMSSPGGQLDATIQTYGFIRALPVPVRMHAQGFVQSAATVLFLAGDERSADRTARFLFHPPQSVTPLATVGEPQVRERLLGFTMVEGVMAQIYRERSRLTDAQIAQFQQEAVVLDAEQAQVAGMVQTVSELHMPDGSARILFVE